MDLHVEHEAGVTIATPGRKGVIRLDSFNAGSFEMDIHRLIDQSSGAVILDLESVSYISSAGVRVILIAVKEFSSRNRGFRLCSLSKPVMKVLSISGIDKTVHICENRAEALASVGQ